MRPGIPKTGVSFSSQWLDGGLPEGFGHLEPLTAPPNRVLLAETAEGRWTAYFDNGIHGPDPFGPVSYLAQEIGCRGMTVTSIEHTIRGSIGAYGAVKFELYGPQPTEWLNLERAVGSYNDGGPWRFINQGTVRPYEQIERYAVKRIKDRFPPELLNSYCREEGIRPFDETFYARSGFLIKKNVPLPRGTKPTSLSEARARLGLVDR